MSGCGRCCVVDAPAVVFTACVVVACFVFENLKWNLTTHSRRTTAETAATTATVAEQHRMVGYGWRQQATAWGYGKHSNNSVWERNASQRLHNWLCTIDNAIGAATQRNIIACTIWLHNYSLTQASLYDGHWRWLERWHWRYSAMLWGCQTANWSSRAR